MTSDFPPLSGALGRRFIDIHRERSDAILAILDAGWRRAVDSPELHAGVGEVEITEHLRAGMRTAVSAKSAAAAPREAVRWKKMTVLPGTETRSRPEVPRPDGRTDIPVFFQDIREEHDEQDPHAIIECKRVVGNDARLCRLYVVEGIDRFSTGKYAANHAVGFMAGYLLAGDAGSAAAGVNRHLTRKGRQSERLVSATFPDTSWVRSSRHPRTAAAPIDLHHAFFGLRPEPT